MKYELYGICDRLNGYTPGIPFLNEELAKRYFKDQVIGNPTIKNSPEDFRLIKYGTFEMETGTYEIEGDPIIIEKGENINV